MADQSTEDQAKPLAPLYLTTRSDQTNEDHDHDHHDRAKHFHSRTRLILCCGFIASLTLLIAFTFIILSLTVFHLHNPNLTVDTISLTQEFDFVNGKVSTTRNTTVSEMISLHNPNAASFRVRDITVTFYYGESVVVGESSRTSETIRAKVTVKMNLTAEIYTAKLLDSVPGLMDDLNGKGVDLRSNVTVNGKVKIMGVFKKSVHLKTYCTMKMMNDSSKVAFQDMECSSEHVQF